MYLCLSKENPRLKNQKKKIVQKSPNNNEAKVQLKTKEIKRCHETH